MRTNINELHLKLISISLGFFISFLLIEIFARLLPATDIFPLELPIKCNNTKEPDYSCIFRRRKFIKGRYIRGKWPPFPIDAQKHTNDIGQFSDINFNQLKNKNKSFLKIISIGDSFVEASQVQNNKTFHGILNKYKSQDKKIVLSTAIGSAGNSLAQYLLHILYADKNIDLQQTTLIIPIIQNDFDESFNKYTQSYPGAKFNMSNPKIIDFNEKLNNKITFFNRFLISNSYIIRYFLLNNNFANLLLEYPLCIMNYKENCPGFKAPRENDNFNKIQNLERYKNGKLATETFLESLTKIRDSREERLKTIFVINADRNIYDTSNSKDNFFQFQRRFFINKAIEYGYVIIDLEETFKKQFKINKKRFDFINDGHWNSYAHRIVAREIIKYLNLEKR
nr:hypothetical protein [Prochlorococcus marinus]